MPLMHSCTLEQHAVRCCLLQHTCEHYHLPSLPILCVTCKLCLRNPLQYKENTTSRLQQPLQKAGKNRLEFDALACSGAHLLQNHAAALTTPEFRAHTTTSSHNAQHGDNHTVHCDCTQQAPAL
jgi:hypothetical protein